jgi:hypothetical protein
MKMLLLNGYYQNYTQRIKVHFFGSYKLQVEI